MTFLNSCPYPEKILAEILLEDIYRWEDRYKEKLKNKYHYLKEEEIRERILNLKSKKFRKQHNKILFIKLKRLKNEKETR